jgi:hypothetical protein
MTSVHADNGTTSSMTTAIDSIFEAEATKIKQNWAASINRHTVEATLFPVQMWDNRNDILQSIDRLECYVGSKTPDEIHGVLMDVGSLRHRLASSPSAQFLHVCHRRADDVMFLSQLHLLLACHASVRRAAVIADAIRSATAAGTLHLPSRDLQASKVASTITDINALSRYLCEEMAQMVQANIRPVLLKFVAAAPAEATELSADAKMFAQQLLRAGLSSEIAMLNHMVAVCGTMDVYIMEDFRYLDDAEVQEVTTLMQLTPVQKRKLLKAVSALVEATPAKVPKL